MDRDWQERCRAAGGSVATFPSKFGDKAGQPACRFISGARGDDLSGAVISWEERDFSFFDNITRIGQAIERNEEEGLGQRVNEFLVGFTDSVKLTGGPNGDILPEGVVGVAANLATKVIDFGSRVIGLPPIVLLALALLAGFVAIRTFVVPQVGRILA